MTVETPECDRMLEVAELSNKIGEFWDWLHEIKRVHMEHPVVMTEDRDCDFCLSYIDKSACKNCGGKGYVTVNLKEEYMPFHPNPNDLLAEYFGIDLQKVEEERRAILEELRERNAQST